MVAEAETADSVNERTGAERGDVVEGEGGSLVWIAGGGGPGGVVWSATEMNSNAGGGCSCLAKGG